MKGWENGSARAIAACQDMWQAYSSKEKLEREVKFYWLPLSTRVQVVTSTAYLPGQKNLSTSFKISI